MPGMFDDLIPQDAAPSEGENMFADLIPQQKSSPTWGETVLDVGKQVLTRPIKGVESLATGPAQLLGLAGKGVEYFFPGDTERVAEQAKIRELAAKQGGAGGVGQYLPKPETKWGEYAGTAAEMVPAGIAQPGSILRRGAEAVGAGLTSEAAGQAAQSIAPEFEPYARMAGALVGGYPVAKTAQLTQDFRRSAAAPTIEKLHEASDNAFKAARALGVEYQADKASNLQRNITKDLLQDGYRPGHGMSTFDRVAELTWEGGINPNFSDIESVRKALTKVAKERNPQPPFGPSENATAALRAIDHIDGFLTNPANAVAGFEAKAEQAARLTTQARGDWAAMSRAKSIEQAVESGELGAGSTGSGANIDNRLRQEARKILKNPRRARGYTAEDKAVLKEIATGTPGRNIARYIGKGTPTGIVSAAAIEYLAHSLGLGPLGHAATIGAAYAGKKAADIGTRHAFRRLGANLRADSPLGRTMDIPMPGIAPSGQAALLRSEIAGSEGFKKGGRVTKTFRYQEGGATSDSGGTPPPENQGVKDFIAQQQAAFQPNYAGETWEGSAYDYARAAMQPGMSGYFDVSNGSIVPHQFTPREVAEQAGVTTGQLASGFGPSGSYDNVGYNIPNDQGGFFNVGANSLPTVGSGLSTNNWRLLGMGPGYIMRQGNLINTRDPATRAGLPAGYDISYSDTAESGANIHRFVAPGAALTGRNKWDAYFWPGSSVTGYTRWPMGTNVKRGGRIKGLPSIGR